jgi:hypothetical protein
MRSSPKQFPVVHCDKRVARTQATIFVIVLSILASISRGQATTQVSGRYEQQLRRECHDLLESVIKKPYGWAWTEDAKPLAAKQRQAIVAMNPNESPAAGLLLLWAGEFLDDAELKDAAKHVARGVNAAKTGAGMVMSRPLFASNAGGRDERAYIPRRDASVAGLALLLEQMRVDPEDGLSKTAAVRIANWLLKQQAQNGAWPSSQPPDAEAKDAIRILRLDNPDFRNSTIALLLAADATGQKNLADHAKKSIDLLMRLRLGRPPHSAGLWATAYSVEGALMGSDYGFPGGADALASRYAMQTLIIGSIQLQQPSYGPAIEQAAKTFHDAELDNHTWPRFFDPGAGRRTASTQPRLGMTTQPVVDVNAEPGVFGIDALTESSAKLQITNLDRYQEDLSRYFTPRRQLLAAMAGMLDDPLVWQTPKDAESARDFLTKHAAKWKSLDDPPAGSLADRVHRIWLLLLRAKLERIDGV